MPGEDRLKKGWPFDSTADFTATWERIEQRAGRKIPHKERCELQDAGIVFKGCTGRPPTRIRYVYTYWSLFLQWMVQVKRKKILPA